MKFIFAALLVLLPFTGLAQILDMEIISAEFAVEDEEFKKTLCLTIVRFPQSGELLGLVEEIHDCFYARKARRSPHNKLTVNFQDFSPLEYQELKSHLQRIDTQLKFYFSKGE